MVEGDLASAELGSGYGAVVSRLAIHHLEDSAKPDLFRRIFAALAPAGIFVDSDMIVGESEAESAALLEAWRDYMRARGDTPGEWEEWLAGDDDHPATERAQLEWLRAAGFVEVRTVWKVAGFAMFSGSKPAAG